MIWPFIQKNPVPCFGFNIYCIFYFFSSLESDEIEYLMLFSSGVNEYILFQFYLACSCVQQRRNTDIVGCVDGFSSLTWLSQTGWTETGEACTPVVRGLISVDRLNQPSQHTEISCMAALYTICIMILDLCS